MYAHEHVVFYIASKVLVNRVWRARVQVLVPSRTFCSGYFGDVLFWFFRGHFDSGMGRISDVHRGDFSGARDPHTKSYVLFCSVLSDSVCNLLILSGNTIYTGIPIIRLSDLLYVHSIFAYVTY